MFRSCADDRNKPCIGSQFLVGVLDGPTLNMGEISLLPVLMRGSMKPDQKWCWLILLLFAFGSPALPQAVTLAADANDSFVNVSRTTQEETISLLELATDGQRPSPPQQTSEKPYGWHIAIYPALAWAPIFGSSVTLPPTPSHPIVSSGSTDSSFNGAYFGGARLERGKWSADALFMWAALSASRKNPHTDLNLDFIFGNAMAGREVFRDLYLEGGFRRLALDVHATVGTDSASRAPGYWDPLIGLTYRKQLSRKWRVLIHGDGGGFGVGSDVDVTATGRAEWQFARHFGLTMGYGGMHFSDTDTRNGQTLKISPTLHGPIFGFGIYF